MTRPPPRHGARRRAVLGLLGCAAILVALAWAAPAPLLAHADLVASEPDDGERVTEALDAVRLEFDEPVEAREVTLLDPRGEPVPTAEPDEDGPVVTQPLGELADTGDHRVRYRVMGADGHLVDGELRFAYAGPTAADPPAPADVDEPAGLARWWPLAAAVGAVALLVAAGVWSWRRLG